MSAGLTDRLVNDLAIHPRTPKTVYAGTGFQSADSGGGVFKSTDGGLSWRAVNAGLGLNPVAALVIDRQNPATLYAGTVGYGVFKSTDGGRRWRAVNAGMAQEYVQALAIDPQRPTTVYAGTYGKYNGVFKSTDSGRRWRAVNTGLPAEHPNDRQMRALAIDPQRPTTVYAGDNDGVFKSTDGGRRWRAANTDLVATAVTALAIDPRKPDRLCGHLARRRLQEHGRGPPLASGERRSGA